MSAKPEQRKAMEARLYALLELTPDAGGKELAWLNDHELMGMIALFGGRECANYYEACPGDCLGAECCILLSMASA